MAQLLAFLPMLAASAGAAAAAAPTIATAGGMAAGVGTMGAVTAAAPSFLSMLGTVSTVAGAGLSTLSSVQQARFQSAASKAQASAARREAQIEEDNAKFEEQQFRRKIGMVLGKQTAISAASGIDITSGSSLFAELDNIRQAEIEALTIRRGGALASSSKLFESRLAKMQARRYRSSIPGIVAGGVVKTGSVLSQMFQRT